MSVHATILRARQTVAQGTAAFHLDKPAGLRFVPGQTIDVVLPPGAAGDEPQNQRHTFSLVRAPFEDELVVATRMRDSAFKRALGALAPGAGLSIEGPSGSLCLHEELQRPAVLIAGGIGITPFMSMLRQAAHDHLARRLVLLYLNRRPEDAAFLAEFMALEGQLESFRLPATMTAMRQSSQTREGTVGPISEAMLKLAADAPLQPIYCIAGPPTMSEAMRLTLTVMGVNDDDIRSEEFYGS